ncbi:MAG: diguanylate cyclase [Sphaerochaetaceae bacterium]|nr:diguanylate cyclase [Sphaerochaetaceae bacterium]
MNDFLLDLLYNVTLLLSLTVIYTLLPFDRFRNTTLKEFSLAIIVAVVGILIMSNPFILAEGVLLDSRSILISVSGMFFSPASTLIVMVILSLFRMILGGAGVFIGVLIIITSGLLGILWHIFRYESFISRESESGKEFYLMGVIVHLAMVLDFLFAPNPLRLQLITSMALPVLILFPFGNYLLSMLLYRSQNQRVLTEKTKESERLFKTMFERAPIGITLTDSRTGEILDLNSKFSQMLKMDKEELLNIDWEKITHPDDIEQDALYMELLLKGELRTYSMDKRYRCSDGNYIWTNIAVSSIYDADEENQRHFCMISDITHLKESENKIMYAYLHDHLTGLPNQFHFMNTLHQIKTEQKYPFTLIIADINGFKIVNDAFSREVGDELLVNISKILVQENSDSDYCARIGGDEFALIIENKDETYREQLIERIQARIERLPRHKVVVSLSFGFARATNGLFGVDELLKKAENDLNQNKLHESPSSRSRALNTFIHTLHEKNPREELHSRRVSLLGARLAKAVGMGPTEIAQMKTAGLLHDIGKISIDEAILNKEGPLNDHEWLEMKKHPEKGYRILLSVGELGEISTHVLSHHERIDGKGYPQGLKGEKIPLQSRIIAIADSFDAMTAWRPYKKIMGEEDAARELIRCSGTQFDSNLVSIFIQEVLQLPHLITT